MSERPTPKEPMTTVPRAFLFDVDGVLTNKDLEVNKDVVGRIGDLVSNGTPVTLLTGRSDTFLIEEILPLIKSSVANKEDLNNIYAVAEFGAVHVKFENGEEIVEVDNELSVPEKALAKSKEAYQEFAGSMWLEPKRTMFTAVRNKGYSADKFILEQNMLSEKLQKVLEEKNLSADFQVHRDVNATNIRNSRANKRHATQVILDWLKTQNLKPELFIALGDSDSDFEMKEELDAQGLPNKFVFVGGKGKLPKGENDPNVVFTNSDFDAGTLEYLSSL